MGARDNLSRALCLRRQVYLKKSGLLVSFPAAGEEAAGVLVLPSPKNAGLLVSGSELGVLAGVESGASSSDSLSSGSSGESGSSP